MFIQKLQRSALIAALIAAIFSLVFSNFAESERSSREIIRDIAVYYGTYEEKANDRMTELLGELRDVEPATGAKWETVIKLWRTVLTADVIHEDVLPDHLPDSDELCIVVLGSLLNTNGSTQGELTDRLSVALASAEKYPHALIVCTGAPSAADTTVATEAGEMAKWLTSHGIDPNRIIIEDQSQTTAQSAINTIRVLTTTYPQVRQLAIVSSDYQITTGVLLFGAASILQASEHGERSIGVVSSACSKTASGTLSTMFQAGSLIELSGDAETAFSIYYRADELPPLPAMHQPNDRKAHDTDKSNDLT